MKDAILMGSAFLLAASLAGVVRTFARRYGILDIPNERSSHHAPTPRGGGIAVVVSVLGVLAYNYRGDPSARMIVGTVAASVLPLAAVGFLDDRRSLSVGARLPVHLLSGLVVAFLVTVVSPAMQRSTVIWLTLWVLWTIISINVVNFMDGIDGLVTVQAIIYGVFLWLMVPPGSLPGVFGLVLAAACLGFLVWNWYPARLFLGDVGSGPLGLFLVVAGILALQSISLILVFLPLYPLFLDALLTLLRRIRRRERITTPHRTHLYQRLANGRLNHGIVTLGYGIAAAGGAFIAHVGTAQAQSTSVLLATLYVALITAAQFLVDHRWATIPQVLRSGSEPNSLSG